MVQTQCSLKFTKPASSTLFECQIFPACIPSPLCMFAASWHPYHIIMNHSGVTMSHLDTEWDQFGQSRVIRPLNSEMHLNRSMNLTSLCIRNYQHCRTCSLGINSLSSKSSLTPLEQRITFNLHLNHDVLPSWVVGGLFNWNKDIFIFDFFSSYTKYYL